MFNHPNDKGESRRDKSSFGARSEMTKENFGGNDVETKTSIRVRGKGKNAHRVMIFGASSGIALEFARRFAERGAILTLIARDSEKLKDLSADLLVRGAKDVSLCAFPLDDLQRSYEATLEIVRQTDTPHTVLIAHGVLGEQEELLADPSSIQRLYQVNVLSPIGILTALENVMMKKGRGTIAVISSVAGDRGRASNFVYGSSKAAISSFVSGMRARLARTKITLITVKPGMVATAMTAHLPRSPLMATAARVADDIIAAVVNKREVLYTPWFWRWIMLVIRCLPEFIFKKLRF